MDTIIVPLYLLLFLLGYKLVPCRCEGGTNNKKSVFVVFLLLFVFFGFRGLPILNDTHHYYNDFLARLLSTNFFNEPLFTYDPFERFEYGFIVYLRAIGKYVTQYPYGLIVISALIVTTANIFIASRNKVNLFIFSYIMLSSTIFLSQYSAMRQGLACSIFYVAFWLLQKDKLFYPLVLLILAMSFHRASLALFPLVFLTKLDFSRFKVFLVVVASLFLMINVQSFGDDSAVFQEQAARETLPIAAFLMLLFSLYITYNCYTLKHRYNLTIPSEHLFWWSTILLIAIQIVSLNLLIVGRYTMFFRPLLIIMYLLYYQQVDCKCFAKRQFLIFLFICFLYFCICIYFKSEWYHLVPYSFYNFGEILEYVDFGY